MAGYDEDQALGDLVLPSTEGSCGNVAKETHDCC